MQNKCTQKLAKNFNKGMKCRSSICVVALFRSLLATCLIGSERSSRQACCSLNAKEPSTPIHKKCGSCGSIACRCSLSSDLTHASLSG